MRGLRVRLATQRPSEPDRSRANENAPAAGTGASRTVGPARPLVGQTEPDGEAGAPAFGDPVDGPGRERSEEHTSELQSREKIVYRLPLEKKNTICVDTSRTSNCL